MKITFTRATPVDATALVQAQIAAFHYDTVLYGVEIGGPPGYDAVETVLTKIAECDYYTIRYNGQIIGGMTIYNQGEGHYHLDLIYITPEYHGLGIGSEAIKFIEQTYPAKRWTLDTPSWAVRNHHFYEKFGYVKVGEHRDDGLLLYAYEKRFS